MVMDKGLSIREAEDMLSVSGPYVDIVKLGFGTSYVTPNLEEDQIIPACRTGCLPGWYPAGSIYHPQQVQRFLQLLDRYGLQHVEVSDGSIQMDHDENAD